MAATASDVQITVDGKPIAAQQHTKLYFALHKPKGYICSSTPSKDAQQTPRLAVELLADWIRDEHQKKGKSSALPAQLFTVGRLDVQSTGLILVTNDGEQTRYPHRRATTAMHIPCTFMQHVVPFQRYVDFAVGISHAAWQHCTRQQPGVVTLITNMSH